MIHQEGARRGLLAFRVADTHAHALLLASREQAGRFARYAEQRLRWHLGLAAPFEPAHFKPVDCQSYLERAFLYVLRQEERHDIRLDLRHEASSAPDLLGMRLLAPDLVDRVLTALPRLHIEELVPLLHLERGEPDFTRLADAAAAALALPDLQSRSGHAAAARAAAIHAASELSNPELADLLQVGRRCIERLRHQTVPAVLVEAVRRQLTFRSTREAPAFPLNVPSDQDAEDWINLPIPDRRFAPRAPSPRRPATKSRTLTLPSSTRPPAGAPKPRSG